MPATAQAAPVALASTTPGLALLGTISVAQHSPLFEQHFPEFAVLPGSLGLALGLQLLFEHLARVSHGVHGAPEGGALPPSAITLRRVAFLAPVRPGDHLTVLLHAQRSSASESLMRLEWLRGSDCVLNAVIAWRHDATTPAPKPTSNEAHAA
ncbi:hypothetical protein QS306_15650 [Paraburkholderia bonniea]|uniref:hypothetical protein n=1 Tax=Paraburkholderia bonniea TaxID=2152891 RepID=UPI0012910508|nr:hypothetical protein [Paraburkholderia bonniea]WJF91523.1 hypothetical protein QS306_15650 [Paraburkholderia bonniea]WJF94842.1 hypothetical protein QS308_15655 [Paraburkholderia bonniea]